MNEDFEPGSARDERGDSVVPEQPDPFAVPELDHGNEEDRYIYKVDLPRNERYFTTQRNAALEHPERLAVYRAIYNPTNEAFNVDKLEWEMIQQTD